MLACLACTVKESSCKLTFHVASFVYLFRKLLNGCFVCLSLQAETIRRAKPIVGEELVDIEYRVFEGLEMVPAEDVVDTMNRLSEAEFVVTLKYAVGVTHLLAFLFNGNLRFLWVLILPSVSVVCVFLFVFFSMSDRYNFLFSYWVGARCSSQNIASLSYSGSIRVESGVGI